MTIGTIHNLRSSDHYLSWGFLQISTNARCLHARTVSTLQAAMSAGVRMDRLVIWMGKYVSVSNITKTINTFTIGDKTFITRQ